jgi:hypothetical protein
MKTLISRTVVLLAAIMATSAMGSLAADAPSSKTVDAGLRATEQLLLLMDTDKNGKVSKEEFLNFMAKEFDRLDTSKDGVLDVNELKGLLPSLSHPTKGPGR